MDLYTKDGRLVGRPFSPALAMMEANGRAPEIVAWGERLFVCAGDRYVEGMTWVLRPDELALA
jgi:hypothetical protein